MPKKKRPSLRKYENETAYALVQAMIGEGPQSWRRMTRTSFSIGRLG